LPKPGSQSALASEDTERVTTSQLLLRIGPMRRRAPALTVATIMRSSSRALLAALIKIEIATLTETGIGTETATGTAELTGTGDRTTTTAAEATASQTNSEDASSDPSPTD
jgi:hypothetical protein